MHQGIYSRGFESNTKGLIPCRRVVKGKAGGRELGTGSLRPAALHVESLNQLVFKVMRMRSIVPAAWCWSFPIKITSLIQPVISLTQERFEPNKINLFEIQPY